MRKKICTWLYRHHMDTLVYMVSPSVYMALLSTDTAKAMAAGLKGEQLHD